MDGPAMVMNLAVVYAWTDDFDLAFETLSPLTKMPFGIFYGQLNATRIGNRSGKIRAMKNS